MKKHVLWVGEKFCDGKVELGYTNSFHNCISTFQQSCPNYLFNTIHLDESSIVYKKHVDEVLLDYCKQYKVEIIFFCLLGGSSYNPSLNCFKQLKEMGIYLCFHFPDFGGGFGTQTVKEIGELGNLFINWDMGRSKYHDNLKWGNNVLFLHVAQDPLLYFNQPNKDIDLSFVGSTTNYQDRQFFLSNLIKFFPNMVIRGGQRQEALTAYEYADLIRRSKISLNFSYSLASHWQIKGRVYEALACGSLLLESKNPATPALFTPGQDYIEFENLQDLINKINYYLTHDSERKQIAESGHKKYMENYTANHFWSKIMNRIEEDLCK